MKRYNEVYSGICKMWREANDSKKHVIVFQMFKWLSKQDKEQAKEFAILDFMDRWVYGTDTSTDYSGIKGERGFAQYAK